MCLLLALALLVVLARKQEQMKLDRSIQDTIKIRASFTEAIMFPYLRSVDGCLVSLIVIRDTLRKVNLSLVYING